MTDKHKPEKSEACFCEEKGESFLLYALLFVWVILGIFKVVFWF